MGFSLPLVLMAAPARRGRETDEVSNPVKSVRADPPDRAAYFATNDRYGTLWRYAVAAYYGGDATASEEAFSLAYKSSPDIVPMLLDYALCSLFYPAQHQSVKRAAGLVAEAERNGAKGARPDILKALIAIQSGELAAARLLLPQAGKAGEGQPEGTVAWRLSSRLALGNEAPTLTPEELELLLPRPAELSPRNRRKGRWSPEAGLQQ